MEKVYFNVSELGIKARTKSELYKLLTIERKLFLPPASDTSIEFIGEIRRGDKKVRFIRFVL